MGLLPNGYALIAPQNLRQVIEKKNKVGGADGIRTHDLLDAIEARSQLRHGPTGRFLAYHIRCYGLSSSIRPPTRPAMQPESVFTSLTLKATLFLGEFVQA